MIKKLHRLFILSTLVLPIGLMAQVTITNSTFPVPGDTLRTISILQAPGFDKEMTGEDLEWDLRDIGGGLLTENVYREPSEGAASEMFPDADLLDNSTPQEIYYQSFNNKIIEIGRAGLDPVLNLIDLTFQNEGEAVLRKAPMSFNDIFDEESSFTIQSGAEVVPDSIIDLNGVADSLRLTVVTSNDDFVDSWGLLRLPGEDYEVLRVKRTTTTNSVLQIRNPVIGWLTLDESSPFFPLLGDLGQLLGETITVSYQFFANDNKEVVANISEDAMGNIIGMTYKGSMTTATQVLDPRKIDVLTYPNPTYGDITFELQNLPKDDYKVVLYNIIGKQLWTSNINFLEGRLHTNLSHLRKGTYLYSIVDGNGRKVVTKRLMIVTP